MMRLTDREISRLVSAGVLFTYCSGVLSEFERGLVADVCRRFIEHGPDTLVAHEEWRAFDLALQGMIALAAPAHVVEVTRTPLAGHGPCTVVAYSGRA